MANKQIKTQRNAKEVVIDQSKASSTLNQLKDGQ